MAAKAKSGKIRVGIGGWTFEPWRGSFYPDGLAQKHELGFASRALTAIEVNGTYYGSQKPATFAKWHDETPEDFTFSLKAPRFATNRRALAEAASSIDRFVNSGIDELKDKLGPINWQFLPSKAYDDADFERFLKLLPDSAGGLALKHVVEVRHDSFRTAEFVALARKHQVAIVLAGDSEYPAIADITAPFTYIRIMGTRENEELGYSEAELDAWAERARTYARGDVPDDLGRLSDGKDPAAPRDVYLYVISGHKIRNPAAAMALISRLGHDDSGE